MKAVHFSTNNVVRAAPGGRVCIDPGLVLVSVLSIDSEGVPPPLTLCIVYEAVCPSPVYGLHPGSATGHSATTRSNDTPTEILGHRRDRERETRHVRTDRHRTRETGDKYLSYRITRTSSERGAHTEVFLELTGAAEEMNRKETTRWTRCFSHNHHQPLITHQYNIQYIQMSVLTYSISHVFYDHDMYELGLNLLELSFSFSLALESLKNSNT
ncbi:unnamed protein product [Danaus chrysippus]|uniref:(African queen) hypothetical protein n=1 Tax=Danaus chrysippus TaxID=151541 RepID=A0A8J2R1R1_9NEOP|nr:unnamed protein product [Danaus chrysippus]